MPGTMLSVKGIAVCKTDTIPFTELTAQSETFSLKIAYINVQ